jgi:hypothetical protein
MTITHITSSTQGDFLKACKSQIILIILKWNIVIMIKDISRETGHLILNFEYPVFSTTMLRTQHILYRRDVSSANKIYLSQYC